MLAASKGERTIGGTDRIEVPNHLKRLGHDVNLVVGESPYDKIRGAKPLPVAGTIYLPMINLPLLTTISYQLSLMLILPFILKRFTPDVVIVDYFSVLSIIPWVLLKRLGLLKSVFILDVRTLPVDTKGWRGWISHQRFNCSLQFANHFMDGITAITYNMRENLAGKFGFSSTQIGVWESGVNIEQFQRASSRRDELGWAGKFVVMYHGTFSPNRGLQDTISAFVLLKKTNVDIKLCLLGAGEAKAELEALTKQLDLEDVIIFLPPVDYVDVADYVVSADIGIVPLPEIDWWTTSSPLKLMEYLAAGKPVVVSNIIAHRSVLGDSPCGYYLQNISAEAIADGILYFYERKNELARLGNLGQEIVQQGYSWEVQANKLSDYLTARINGNAGQTGEIKITRKLCQ